MLKRTKVSMAVLAALSGAALLAPTLASAQSQTVEVTGSRLKRADIEGSLPVTTISREELQASGSVTVAEFMRTSTFSSAGNFRPQSGSSAQSFAGIDLRGLGSNRTLVLIDGRRLPKAPNVGDSADLNTVPMAAVERIEILTDGASAIYGSDAIGGVVNIITRKDWVVPALKPRPSSALAATRAAWWPACPAPVVAWSTPATANGVPPRACPPSAITWSRVVSGPWATSRATPSWAVPIPTSTWPPTAPARTTSMRWPPMKPRSTRARCSSVAKPSSTTTGMPTSTARSRASRALAVTRPPRPS